MKFSVETWSPEYGAPASADLVDAEVEPELEVEVQREGWEPLTPTIDPTDNVVFVDGVRRVDANLWINQPEGFPALGLCATYGAGAVLCSEHSAELIAAEVERGLFTAAVGAEDVATTHGTFVVQATHGAAPEELWLGIQDRMGKLEGRVSARVAGTGLTIADGPLSHHRHVPDAVGMIKTQHRHYLPPELRWILAALPAGRRTPLFLLGGGATRWSWYLRLATGSGPIAGVVRCELAADRGVTEAARIADTVTATLPRFASDEYKDPRAPQNLYPIGGLERGLRRRLGDQRLIFRALRRVAAGG